MPASSRLRLLSMAIFAVIAAELLHRAVGLPLSRQVSWLAVISIVVLALPQLGFREFYLLTFSTIIVAVQYLVSAHPAEVLMVALDQASFLMAFIFLLSLLHEAASTSPSVAACGEYLTRQPSGRRYYALNMGTAALSVLFNVGTISFLVPLIQRGIERATPNHPLNPIRERRQVSALLRGFAWSVIWSPTAIAPIVVAELIPGTDRQVWFLYGFVLFLFILVAGAFEDRWRFRSFRPANNVVTPTFPRAAFLRFFASCTWLFGMAAGFVWLTGDTVIFGLLMACPLMLLGWLSAQYGFPDASAVPLAMTRIRSIFRDNMTRSAPVAISLGCSGFIGSAAANLVPAETLAEFLMLDVLPDYFLLAMIPVVLSVLSLLALSPIMMAVFFGSLFGALPTLPADPTLIAFAISCGWALSMTFSPFATVVLVISRISGISGKTMTWDWNLWFSLLSAALLFPVFALITGGH